MTRAREEVRMESRLLRKFSLHVGMARTRGWSRKGAMLRTEKDGIKPQVHGQVADLDSCLGEKARMVDGGLQWEPGLSES